MPTSPSPTVDLDARRRRAHRAVQTAAAAPVRHLPASLLHALQGSWGTPEELLGLPAPVVRLAAAR